MKYEAVAKGTAIVTIEHDRMFNSEVVEKLNAIFRAHEDREKREKECKLCARMRERNEKSVFDFCFECGRDMRGEV